MLELCNASKQNGSACKQDKLNVVSRRCASSCRSTELHEDLVVVADLQLFTDCQPETILHVNECRDSD